MGHMSRVVRCNDALGNIVDDEKCSAETKPVERQQCYRDGSHCKLLWQYTSWSKVGHLKLTVLLDSLLL